jgi:LCP family protein required for cell wall assembly
LTSHQDEPGGPETPETAPSEAAKPKANPADKTPDAAAAKTQVLRQLASPRMSLRGPSSWLSQSSAWFRRTSTKSLVLRGVAILSALVFVAGSLAAYMKYRTVWNSIKRIDVSQDLKAPDLPPADPNAINVLLIGSDGREGVNGKIGGSAGISGARSDTDIILHIAPGAHQVVVISFPRDSVVPILNCGPEDGTTGQVAQPAPAIEQINSTFAYGGPGCLWETIEQTTGIHINDFIELSFEGFEKAIDALGGVNVCVPAAVDDPISGLDLSAGKHHVWGKEALAFWRTREGVGEGDDPQRIQRDQYLMASLAQGLARSGLLSSPGKILRVIDAVTGHGYITTDEQLSSSRLLEIGEALRGVSTGSMQFVEVPWTTYAPNPNWVQWSEPSAGDLFSAIAHDSRLPTAHRAPRHHGKRHHGKKSRKLASTSGGTPATTTTTQATSSATTSSSHSKAPAPKPSQVQVEVFNGTTTTNLGTSAATALGGRGFQVIGQAQSAASDKYVNSVIEYASRSQYPAAELLAQQLSHVHIVLDPQLGATKTLTLILGSAFTGLKPPALSSLATTYGGITGNVNICSDQGAFSGPLGD